MEQTLHIGDRILVNRLDHDIVHGDVVVFGHGNTWQEDEGAAGEQRRRRAPCAPSATSPASGRATRPTRSSGSSACPGRRWPAAAPTARSPSTASRSTSPTSTRTCPFTAGTLDCSSSPRSTRCFPEITVPSDNLLVMGDHRSESADSVIGCRGATEGPECARLRAREPRGRAGRAALLAARRHRPPPELTRRPPERRVRRQPADAPTQPRRHAPGRRRPRTACRQAHLAASWPETERIRRWRRRRGCAARRRW